MVKKNNKTKFVTGVATAALVATAVVPVASAASFKDLGSVGTSVKAEIDRAVELGFFKDATTFNPAKNIPRSQAAITLARYIAGEDSVKTYVEKHNLESEVTPFTDVPVSFKTGPDYQQELYYASLIVKNAGAFSQSALKPLDQVKRSQMAKIITKTFGLEKADGYTSNLTDIGHLDAETKGYIETIASHNITNVRAFMPAGDVTRSQMASFLVRAYDKAMEAAEEPAVQSVKSLNATQVEVIFNKPVNKATLFEDGKSGAFKSSAAIAMETVSADNMPAGSLSGVLSEDGLKLVITASNKLQKRYAVVIDGLKTIGDKEIARYEEMINIAADTTPPKIEGTEVVNASTVKVKFSEPMSTIGNVKFQYADGTAIGDSAFDISFNTKSDEVTFEMGDLIEPKREIIATFIGAKDLNDNLISPNPAKADFQKGAKDGVPPTVGTITQTGATTFSVKFSEKLRNTPTIKYAGADTTVSVDSEDATVFHAKVADGTILEGAKTVMISNYVDLSGEEGTSYSKIVTFEKDTEKPSITKSEVIKGTDGKEYLTLTFNKNVQLDDAKVSATGKYVKDYVTSPLLDFEAKELTYKDSADKKVVHVPLSALLAGKDVQNADYALDLTFEGVKSEAGEVPEVYKATFTRSEETAPGNTNVAAVTELKQDAADNNLIYVTFDQAVDGASATTKANYQIDNAVVENVTLNAVSDGKQVAVLHLKPGSNTFTGPRNINIKNVKAKGSSEVMTPYFTNSISIKENVAPTVTSAKLTDTKEVTLTFSENVKTKDPASATDFEVLVNGSTVAGLTATTATHPAPTNQVKLSLSRDVTNAEITSGLSLKPQGTLDIKDVAGNKLSVPQNIVITQ